MSDLPTHDDPWLYEQSHTSTCDEGPNHSGPCHQTQGMRFDEVETLDSPPCLCMGMDDRVSPGCEAHAPKRREGET